MMKYSKKTMKCFKNDFWILNSLPSRQIIIQLQFSKEVAKHDSQRSSSNIFMNFIPNGKVVLILFDMNPIINTPIMD